MTRIDTSVYIPNNTSAHPYLSLKPVPFLLLSYCFLNYAFSSLYPRHHSNAQHTCTHNYFPIHTKSLSCILYSKHVPYPQVPFSEFQMQSFRYNALYKLLFGSMITHFLLSNAYYLNTKGPTKK